MLIVIANMIVLLARKPFDVSAEKILELVAIEKAQLFISINSFTDIIYSVRKEYDTNIVRERMDELLDFLAVIEAEHKDAEKRRFLISRQCLSPSGGLIF